MKKNMHEICKKYARNMQKYASICRAVSAAEICKNMQIICDSYAKNMQNMQLRFVYAKYAKICTPHFADVNLNLKLA